MRIIAEAPCRVDLAGGTLDIWPLYLFHPGAGHGEFRHQPLYALRD